MAKIYEELSRTFSEYLMIPNLTTKECYPDNIDLRTPLTKFEKGSESEIALNIPFTSAIMQSVSNDTLAIALAKRGGLSFIFCSQPIDSQVEMVKKVKKFKAGFVVSDSNLTKEHTLKDVLTMKAKSGHSTIPITDDGTSSGKLEGIVTSRDYRISRDGPEKKVKEFMTPFNNLVTGPLGISLSEANDIIWDHKLNCLPIIDEKGNLCYLVFRKDYDEHKENPMELLDHEKRYMCGAGVNTHDYKKRIPALVESGADVLCIDSSDGFSEWQKDVLKFVKNEYEGKILIGAGNVVDEEGFEYLAKAGADFIKVGIGGGSICITREQKGIGRGQASAIIETVKYRDKLYKEKGIYIPICSDGGIVYDYHIALALAMGSDFVMMGRYFARFDESPTKVIKLGNNYVKEYWGEGSERARNWQRYESGQDSGMKFEEGVDSYVPYAGKLSDNLNKTVAKIKNTMASCGSVSIRQLHETARIAMVSSTSIVEGGAHDVILKDKTEF